MCAWVSVGLNLVEQIASLSPCFVGRYVLVTAGPVFTEEMWRLACCALQDAFTATLKPVKVGSQREESEQAPLPPTALSSGADE